MSSNVGDGAQRGGLSKPHAGRTTRPALDAAERRDLLLLYANDVILLFDEEYRLVDCNDRAVEAYGYSRAELLTKSIGDLRAQQPQIALDERMAAVRARGSAVFESENRRKDGSTFPVETSVRAVETPKGLFYHTTVRDISERRTVEADLQRSLGLLDHAERAAHIGHWYWDRETGAIQPSPALLRIFGVDPASHRLWADLRRVVHPDDREERDRTFARVTHGERVVTAYRIVLSGGETRYVEGSGEPQFDADGELTGAFGVAQDVTERKLAELDLARREEEQRTVLTSVTENIVTLDPEGRITYINHAEPGIDERDVIGSFWADWLDEATQSRALAAARMTVETGEPQELEFLAPGPHRRPTWYHVLMAPLPESSPDAIVLVATDVTHSRQADRDLRDAAKRMEQAERTAHLGHWRHDVRTGALEASEELLRIFGAPPGASAEDAEQYVHPDDREHRREVFARALAGRPYARHEWRAIRPDGAVRYLEGAADPVFDEAGDVVAVFGVTQDVTERAEALRAARESAEQYRALLDNMLEGVAHCRMIYDDQGRPDDFAYLSVNPAFNRLTGLEDAAGRRVTELMPTIKDQNPELFEIYGNVAATGEPAEFDIDFAPLDKWLHVSATRPREGEFVAFFSDVTARVQAERLARESEAQLRLSLAAANAGTWEWDLRTDVNTWSDELWDLYGLDPAEHSASYDAWVASIWPDDRATVEAELSAAVAEGGELSFEWRVNTRDGTMRWLLSRGSPELDDAGEIIRYRGVVVDVTERRLTLDALREREQSYSAIFNESPFAILLSRMPDATIVSANAAFLSEFECGLGDIVGKTIPEVGITDEASIAAMAAELLEHGSVRDREVVRTTLAGKEVTLSISLTQVSIGGQGHVLTTIRDVTEQKRAEQQLQESRAKLEAAMASMTDAVFISDAEGSFLDFNDAFATFHRFGSREECLRTLAEYPDILDVSMDGGERAPLDQWAVPRALRGETVADAEYGLRRKDTGESWVGSYSFAPIRDEAGAIAGSVVVARDVTDRKKAERDLKESEERHRELFENMAQGVVYQLADGTIDAANPAAERILGVTAAQLRGRTSMDPRWRAVREDGSDLPGEEHPAAVALRTGQRVHAVVMGVFLPEEGAYRWLSVDAVPEFRAGEDEPYRVFTTFGDITERKRSEEALRQSEAEKQTALDAAELGVWWYDLGAGMIVFDERGRRHFGFATNVASMDDAFARVHPDDVDRLAAAVAAAVDPLAGTGRYALEYRVIPPGEPERWLSVAVSVAFEGEGEGRRAVRTYGTSADVTDRKRMEEDLRRSEAEARETVVRLSRAQQLGRMGDWDWDVAGGEVHWSEEIYRTYGVGPDFETTFDAIVAMTHPDDNETDLRETQAILDDPDRSSAALTFRIRRPDGALRHIFQTLAIERTADGEPTRVFGIMQDVTELREAEQALLRSEQRFRRFYDAGLVGVAFWTVEGRIVDANDRFLEMLGYTREDLHAGAVDWAAMTPPEYAARDEESLEELRATGRNAVPFEKEFYAKDGTRLPVLVTGAILDGEASSGIVLVLDVTDQKLAERDLRRLNFELEDRVRRRTADLEAANKELESFSYSVSHDLRAPLRHIAGFAELLRGSVGGGDDDDTGHYIDVITHAANDMGILIDDLLEFSRVGRAEMHVRPVDMEQLVREVLDVAGSDLGDRRVEVAAGDIAPATGDRTLLRQVWANLIGNAYKYTRPRDPAVIEIGSRRDDGECVYWVRDNGVGFDLQYAGRLFHVFERLHRAEEFEGTGIGLANVQRIVGRHDGRCWAEAEEGKGATFFFSLPNG